MSSSVHTGVGWQRDAEKRQPAPASPGKLPLPPPTPSTRRKRDGNDLSSSFQLPQMKLSRALCLKLYLPLNSADRLSTLWIQ